MMRDQLLKCVLVHKTFEVMLRDYTILDTPLEFLAK